MRQVSQLLEDAINSDAGISPRAKIIAYRSRIYFDNVNEDFSSSSAVPVGNVDMHTLGEDFALVDNTHLVTVVSSKNNKLEVSILGNSFVSVQLNGSDITCLSTCKPAISNTGKIVFFDGSAWKSCQLDATTLANSSTADVVSVDDFNSLEVTGAAHFSRDTFAIFFNDEGGVRVRAISNDGTSWSDSTGRFFRPTEMIDASETSHLHHSGIFDNSKEVFFYYSMSNGSVVAFRLNKIDQDASIASGEWSPSFEAVPQDLSTSRITSVFYNSEGDVFLVVRFSRNDDYSGATPYILLLKSKDGITFSLDRRSLVTSKDLNFKVALSSDESTVFFSSSGRYVSAETMYSISYTKALHDEAKIISVSGSDAKSLTVIMSSDDFDFASNREFKKNAIVYLYTGLFFGGETQYVQHTVGVISSIKRTVTDGKIAASISIVPEGLWQTQNMSHPLYLEVSGRDSVLKTSSHLDELDNLTSLGVAWSLYADIWKKTTSYSGSSHGASSSTELWSFDVKETAEDYPTFGDDDFYECKIYGWSRAGNPDHNPNIADNTNRSSNNDDFYPILVCEDLDGGDVRITGSISDLSSAHANPPQTYFTEGIRDGSYPVIFNIRNPGEGYKVKKIGVKVVSPSTGGTVFFVERIEMPKVVGRYIDRSYNQDTEDSSTSWTLLGYETIQVTTDNATNGNELVSNLSLSADKCYAIVAKGQVSFTRGGFDYIQDPNNFIEGMSPDWDTGGEQKMSSVSVYALQDPRFSASSVYMNDNPIPFEEISSNHAYLFLDSSRDQFYIKSQIPENRIPYVHGGSTLKIKFNLAGDGEISNISDGEFTFYVFESPYPYSEFKFYEAADDELYQVPTPSVFGYSIPGEEPTTYFNEHIQSIRKGVHNVRLSASPYTAWNFDAIVQVSFMGPYTYAGVIGLASSNTDFVVGYVTDGKVGFGKIRSSGMYTIKEIESPLIKQDVAYEVSLKHRDGVFTIDVKRVGLFETEVSMSYEWKFVDGKLAANKHVHHVGAWSFIDPPKFRTSGLYSDQAFIPVMPCEINPVTGASDFDELFPTSGEVDASGAIFEYGNKASAGTEIRGPFQIRTITQWESRFNLDQLDHTSYSGNGKAVELTMFDYYDSSHKNDYSGRVISSKSGYNWSPSSVMHLAWITTGGVVVLLRNRARFYADNQPSFYPSDADKFYVTKGLTGLEGDFGNDLLHVPYGSFVYLHSNDEASIYSFTASSIKNDFSVRGMIAKFCGIAGAEPLFPGDIICNLSEVTTSPQEIL